jgi:bifunctional polynucleotide phosphatase/kinase
MKLIWQQKSYIIAKTNDFIFKEKIASFDIDSTIIKTNSGKKFPIDKNDWVMLYDNTITTLNKYHIDGYCIIFISNQSGIKDNNEKLTEWTSKIDNVVEQLNIPVCVFASIEKDMFRKPLPTLWYFIKQQIELNNQKINPVSFFCGDAAGRPTDFNDTDYKFALNSKIMFYVPEQIFKNESSCKHLIQTSYVNVIDIPLERKYKFKPIESNNKLNEMIIMVGYPASGKSTFVQKYIEPCGYVRINQDILKTSKKCLSETIKALDNGQNVVIDNINHTIKKRNEFIKLAKKYNYNIRCLVMEITFDLAVHNMMYRFYKSNGHIERIPDVVYYKIRKEYETPSIVEQIDSIDQIDQEKPNDPDYLLFFS